MKVFLRSLFLSWALTSCASTTQIQHGLDEQSANEILSTLLARGFVAHKEPEKGKKLTWAIELEERHAAEAMQLLTELKLPRPQRLKTQTLASNVGLIDTPAAEKLRQLEAEEGDIEEALETMDGVTSAAVELVVPTAPRPGQNISPSKASVLLRAHPAALERLQMQRTELRALVAASVEGLHVDDVVLVIDAVTIPVPLVREEPPQVKKPLVMMLGSALCVVALLLVLLSWKLKKAKRSASLLSPTTSSKPPPSTGTRPVINPSIQRNVA